MAGSMAELMRVIFLFLGSVLEGNSGSGCSFRSGEISGESFCSGKVSKDS